MKGLINRIRLQFAYTEKNVGLVVAEGTLWACVIQLTNPFYLLFAKQMGGGDIAISLVNALPALFALVTLLPLSAYIDTVPQKKILVGKMIGLYAIILPIAAIAPFLGKASVPLFIIAIALFNVPLLGYTVGWQSFFSDIFTARQRVMPYANREMMRNVIQALAMLIGGFVLSYLCNTDGQKIATYQVLFMAAFGFALLQRKMLLQTDDSHVVPKPVPKMKMWDTYRLCIVELKKNKKLTQFLVLMLLFYIAAQMAWPMFFIFVIDYAGANEFTKNLLDISGVVLFALTANYWGRFIQRRGAKLAGIIGMYTASLSPLWLVLWSSPVGLFANYIFCGVFSAAQNIGLFHDMLEQLPEENKTFCIGIYNMVAQLAAFIAPLIGVAIYKATSMGFVMTFSTVFRAIATTFFLIRYLKSKKTEVTL